MSLEGWKAFFEIGGVILLFLTFVFGAGALLTSTRINTQQAERLRNFDSALTDAKFELSEQQERTADAERDAAEAKKAADDERLARLRLQQEIAPRRLTGQQRTELTNLLKSFPDAVQVAIVSVFLDGESSDFADDLNAAIMAANWKTTRIRNRLTSKFGVSVGVVEGTPETDQSGRPIASLKQRLTNALRTIGVPCQDVTFGPGDLTTINPAFERGVIYLVIEKKPSPKDLGPH